MISRMLPTDFVFSLGGVGTRYTTAAVAYSPSKGSLLPAITSFNNAERLLSLQAITRRDIFRRADGNPINIYLSCACLRLLAVFVVRAQCNSPVY